MSRFLQHLVERAQGAGERLERRRPALFESRRTPSRAVDELAEEQAWATPPAPEPHLASFAEPTHRARAAEADATVLPTTSAAPLAVQAPLRSPASLQVRSPVLHPQSAVTAPDRIPPSTQPSATLQAPRLLSANQLPAMHSPMPARKRADSSTGEQRREGRRDETFGKQRPPSSSPLPPPTRLATPTPMTTAVAHPARRANGSPAPAPAPPPPVHVSIGRIEIRAATTATPAPSPAPSRSPALTLDDYLRRRHGERR